MKILKQVSKNLSTPALLLVVMLLQNCRKDTAVNNNGNGSNILNAPPKQGMYALINDTAWTAVTVSASLSYSAGLGKVFACQGTMGNRVIQLTAIQNTAAAGNNFPLGDANNNLTSFNYYIMPIHRELTEQNPTAGKSPGTSLVITNIDPNNQLISGTFTFPQVDSAFDANYNFLFGQNNQIANGFFKQVHYVYTP